MFPRADCSECQRLLDRYSEAIRELVRCGRHLTGVAGSYERDMFQRWWSDCQAAKERCADLRKTFGLHVRKHAEEKTAAP